jgi:putative SOS response-associated peptidase YedK
MQDSRKGRSEILVRMCDRYVWAPKDLEDFRNRFELTETNQKLMEIQACFNIGPGYCEPGVVKNSPNHIEINRWGLIPPWARDIQIGYKMINARAETILNKVSFKRPFKNRRCIIPISGFCE